MFAKSNLTTSLSTPEQGTTDLAGAGLGDRAVRNCPPSSDLPERWRLRPL